MQLKSILTRNVHNRSCILKTDFVFIISFEGEILTEGPSFTSFKTNGILFFLIGIGSHIKQSLLSLPVLFTETRELPACTVGLQLVCPRVALQTSCSPTFGAIKAFKKGVLYHGENCNRGPRNDRRILEPTLLLVNR